MAGFEFREQYWELPQETRRKIEAADQRILLSPLPFRAHERFLKELLNGTQVHSLKPARRGDDWSIKKEWRIETNKHYLRMGEELKSVLVDKTYLVLHIHVNRRAGDFEQDRKFLFTILAVANVENVTQQRINFSIVNVVERADARYPFRLEIRVEILPTNPNETSLSAWRFIVAKLLTLRLLEHKGRHLTSGKRKAGSSSTVAETDISAMEQPILALMDELAWVK